MKTNWRIVLILCGGLGSTPVQAEDMPAGAESSRKPVTCTDAAGILYERGTPGFERCLQEMEQAAREESPPPVTPEKIRKKKPQE